MKCPHCRRSFINYAGLHAHLRAFHPDDLKPASEAIEEYKICKSILASNGYRPDTDSRNPTISGSRS